MVAGISTRVERITFLVLSAVVLAYIVLRAALVPVVHDEAMTFFIYVETGDLLPFHAHWDAGNHLLCSALAWLSYSVFGFHAWALRLPSILAFVLYAFYAWRWGTRLSDPIIRWCLWAALLLTPFLLDFFSLFRGYGLAMAFWSMALFELCAMLEHRTTRKLWLTLIAMACAAFSSLSLLTLWAAVLAVVGMVILHRPVQRRPLAIHIILWLVLGAAPFLFATAYAHELSVRGALYYGADNGILGGTLASLLKAMFGMSNIPLIACIVLVVLLGTVAAWRVLRKQDRSFSGRVLVIAALFLWAEIMGREFLFHWNGTLFPEDRTALQWVPLVLLLFGFALDRQVNTAPGWKWFACLLLVLPLRTIATANLATTTYWPEQAIPDAIFRAVQDKQRGSSRLLTIGAYHQMPACWAFGMRSRDLRLNAVESTEFPHGGEDLLLIDPRHIPVPTGYREVEAATSGRVALYERDRPMTTTLLLDSLIPSEHSDAEFRELWHPAMETVRGRSFLVELEMTIRPDNEPMTGNIVTEIDVNGTAQHYDNVLMQFIRHPAHTDSIRTMRHLPRVPEDAERTVVFLWDPAGGSYSSSGRMRVYLVGGTSDPAHSSNDKLSTWH